MSALDSLKFIIIVALYSETATVYFRVNISDNLWRRLTCVCLRANHFLWESDKIWRIVRTAQARLRAVLNNAFHLYQRGLSPSGGLISIWLEIYRQIYLNILKGPNSRLKIIRNSPRCLPEMNQNGPMSIVIGQFYMFRELKGPMYIIGDRDTVLRLSQFADILFKYCLLSFIQSFSFQG